MEKNLLENAGSKMVWRGGHSGLKLEVYEGGVLAVGNGEGNLIVALKATNVPTHFDFTAMVDSMRGYCCNHSEASMMKDAFFAALRN